MKRKQEGKGMMPPGQLEAMMVTAGAFFRVQLAEALWAADHGKQQYC